MHALAGELDIRRMGNLRSSMPITHWTFLVGSAALAGIPLFSGFFSKDEILWHAWQSSPFLWLVGLATSAITALYAFRVLFVAFWGQQRDEPSASHPHDPAPIMTVPLLVLTVGAALGGFIGLPRLSLIDRWLEPVFSLGSPSAAVGGGEGNAEWLLLVVSGLVAVGGLVFAYQAYVVNTDVLVRIRRMLGGLGRVASAGYYVDPAYEAVLLRPVRNLARRLAGPVDQRGIDGAVNGIAGLIGQVGVRVSRLQSGLVGLYALSIVFGAVALLLWLLVQ
jgi:NADH-quinone oxidoreductase subunit L